MQSSGAATVKQNSNSNQRTFDILTSNWNQNRTFAGLAEIGEYDDENCASTVQLSSTSINDGDNCDNKVKSKVNLLTFQRVLKHKGKL